MSTGDGAARGGLEVDRLTIDFPEAETGSAFPGVRELSFRIAPREIVGLVGASGSGKSLTTLALLGLAPPAARVRVERLRLGGTELSRARPAEWRKVRGRRIALVFQEPLLALNPVLTLGAQVAETVRCLRGLSSRSARREALALLASVLPEPARMARSFPHELSGGQRQRGLLALALAGEPELLIADEPTTALDARTTLRLLETLAALPAERNLSILFVSHDLGAVAAVAERALVLAGGRLAEEGSVRTLFDRPSHPATIALVEAARAAA